MRKNKTKNNKSNNKNRNNMDIIETRVRRFVDYDHRLASY